MSPSHVPGLSMVRCTTAVIFCPRALILNATVIRLRHGLGAGQLHLCQCKLTATQAGATRQQAVHIAQPCRNPPVLKSWLSAWVSCNSLELNSAWHVDTLVYLAMVAVLKRQPAYAWQDGCSYIDGAFTSSQKVW